MPPAKPRKVSNFEPIVWLAAAAPEGQCVEHGELTALIAALERIDTLKSEEQLKATISGAMGSLAQSINADWSGEVLEQAIESLKKLLPEQPAKTSTIVPRTQQTIDAMSAWLAALLAPAFIAFK